MRDWIYTYVDVNSVNLLWLSQKHVRWTWKCLKPTKNLQAYVKKTDTIRLKKETIRKLFWDWVAIQGTFFIKASLNLLNILVCDDW